MTMSDASLSMVTSQQFKLKRLVPLCRSEETERTILPRLENETGVDELKTYQKAYRARLARAMSDSSSGNAIKKPVEEGQIKSRLNAIYNLTMKLIQDILGDGSPKSSCLQATSTISPLTALPQKIRNKAITVEEYGSFLSLLRRMFLLAADQDLATSLREAHAQLQEPSFTMVLASLIGRWLYENIFSQLNSPPFVDAGYVSSLQRTDGMNMAAIHNHLSMIEQLGLQGGISASYDDSDLKVSRLVADFIHVLKPYVSIVRIDDPAEWGARCDDIVRCSLKLINDMTGQYGCKYSFFMPSMCEMTDTTDHSYDFFSFYTPPSARHKSYIALSTMAGVNLVIFDQEQEKPLIAAGAKVLVQRMRPTHPSQYPSVRADASAAELTESLLNEPPFSPLSDNDYENVQLNTRRPAPNDDSLHSIDVPEKKRQRRPANTGDTRRKVPTKTGRDRRVKETTALNSHVAAEDAVSHCITKNSVLYCPFKIEGKDNALKTCRARFDRKKNKTFFSSLCRHIRDQHQRDFTQRATYTRVGFEMMIRQGIARGSIVGADLCDSTVEEDEPLKCGLGDGPEDQIKLIERHKGVDQNLVLSESWPDVDEPIENQLARPDDTFAMEGGGLAARSEQSTPQQPILRPRSSYSSQMQDPQPKDVFEFTM